MNSRYLGVMNILYFLLIMVFVIGVVTLVLNLMLLMIKGIKKLIGNDIKILELSNKQLNILKKTSYVFAFIQYFYVIIFMYVVENRSFSYSSDTMYFLGDISRLLFSINLYLFVINIIFLRKKALLLLQIIPTVFPLFISSYYHDPISVEWIVFLLKELFRTFGEPVYFIKKLFDMFI